MMISATTTGGWWTEGMWFPASIGFVVLIASCLVFPKLWEYFAPSGAAKRACVIGAAVLQWLGVILLSGLFIAAFRAQPAVVLQMLGVFGIPLYLIGYTELRVRTDREAREKRRSEAEAIRVGG